MTRKHFDALAAKLAANEPNATYDRHGFARRQWVDDVLAVASVCADANPAFNRTRFLDACGIANGVVGI